MKQYYVYSLTSTAEQQQFYGAFVVNCTGTSFSCRTGLEISRAVSLPACPVTADEVLWWVTVRLIHTEDVVPLIQPAKNGQGSKETAVNRATWMASTW